MWTEFLLFALRCVTRRWPHCSAHARLVLVACSWLVSTFLALMFFVMSREFFDLSQILGIIMCIGVSPVSYIIIFHTLRRLQSQVQNLGPGDGAVQNPFNINRYKKSVSTALWVYGSLLACYLPFILSAAAQVSVESKTTFIGTNWFTLTQYLHELDIKSHFVLLEDPGSERVSKRNYQTILPLSQIDTRTEYRPVS